MLFVFLGDRVLCGTERTRVTLRLQLVLLVLDVLLTLLQHLLHILLPMERRSRPQHMLVHGIFVIPRGITVSINTDI